MQKRILIADDDIKAVERRKKALEIAGYEVIAVNDGGQAIEQLRKSRFDLVLLDLEMPRVSGNEVLKVIREDPQLKDTKVLVVTALSGQIQDRAKEAGFSHRGWAGKFDMVEKWSRDGSSVSRYPGHRVDWLSTAGILKKVKEMFDYYQETDRPKQPQETDKILIADADRESIRNIESILKEKGHEVFYVATTEEALKALGEKDIDLLLTELALEGLNGIGLIQIMGNNFVLENIPAVVFTAVRDFDKPDKDSLRRQAQRKLYDIAVFEKQRKRRFFKDKDYTYDVIKKIEELLKERRRMGWGYKKSGISFVRNNKGVLLSGCIEGFRPISSYDRIGAYCNRRFHCNFCDAEKHKDEAMCIYEPNIYAGYKRAVSGPGTCGVIYICFDCAIWLADKYPRFGKWWQEKSGISLRELIRKNKEVMMQAVKEKAIDMPSKITSIIERCLTEKMLYGSQEAPDITPDSRFDEDLGLDLTKEISLWLSLMDELDIEDELDMMAEEGKLPPFKTVADLISYIAGKVKK